MSKRPSACDGKPIGRPMQAITVDASTKRGQKRAHDAIGLTFTEGRGRFSRVRGAALLGEQWAIGRLRVEIGKWLDRGMKIPKIAKRLQLSEPDVLSLTAQTVVAAPRLVKRA